MTVIAIRLAALLVPRTAKQSSVVAQARIDGEISPEEREVIVRIAMGLGILNDEFQTVYTKGVDGADACGKRRA